MASSFVFRTSDLPKLDLDVDWGTDFHAWHQQWLAYRDLPGLSSEPAAKQVQAIQLCFSREATCCMINETLEWRTFRERKKHQGESFDDFLISFRELAKTCNFCNNDCNLKAICDQLIEGLQDGKTRQVLLQVKDLTLNTAIMKCCGLETAKKSQQDIEGTPEINAVPIQHAKKQGWHL